MVHGECLCGALRYEVSGPLLELQHCHCSRCRKHHGAPFVTWLSTAKENLRWLAGEDVVAHYTAAAYTGAGARTRSFCPTCSSVAPTPVGERVLLPAGNLLGQWNAAPGVHVFVGSKAPWHAIADGLPQYESAAPGSALPTLPTRPSPELEGATHGSCLCGAVTFSVRGEPLRWLQCHCSRCRRGRSAAHASNAFYPANQFAWATGRERVRLFRPPEAERFTLAFCSQCGGGAPVERDQVPFVLVPAGLLDSDPGVRPQAHIHVASQASWYAITDALPQFAELPP